MGVCSLGRAAGRGVQYVSSDYVDDLKNRTDEKVFDALIGAGHHVLPHTGQRGADGEVLKILQHYQSQEFKW